MDEIINKYSRLRTQYLEEAQRTNNQNTVNVALAKHYILNEVILDLKLHLAIEKGKKL